jgi:hypothetical protein
MQTILHNAGYVLDVDGDFGEQTKNAVLTWKTNNDRDTSPDVSPDDMALMKSPKTK